MQIMQTAALAVVFCRTVELMAGIERCASARSATQDSGAQHAVQGAHLWCMMTSDTFAMLGWWKLSMMLISRREVIGNPSRSFSICAAKGGMVRVSTAQHVQPSGRCPDACVFGMLRGRSGMQAPAPPAPAPAPGAATAPPWLPRAAAAHGPQWVWWAQPAHMQLQHLCA